MQIVSDKKFQPVSLKHLPEFATAMCGENQSLPPSSHAPAG